MRTEAPGGPGHGLYVLATTAHDLAVTGPVHNLWAATEYVLSARLALQTCNCHCDADHCVTFVVEIEPAAFLVHADQLHNSNGRLDSGSRSIYNLFMKRDVPNPRQIDQMATDCIAVRVRLINRVLTGLYDEALRPHGLRVGQGNILVAVARMGEASPAHVCRMLRLEKSTLSRDVEVMKRQGWLESDPPAGGRKQVLRVTSAGMDILAKSQPAWESAQAQAKHLIGESGVDALHKMAERLGLGHAPT